MLPVALAGGFTAACVSLTRLHHQDVSGRRLLSIKTQDEWDAIYAGWNSDASDSESEEQPSKPNPTPKPVQNPGKPSSRDSKLSDLELQLIDNVFDLSFESGRELWHERAAPNAQSKIDQAKEQILPLLDQIWACTNFTHDESWAYAQVFGINKCCSDFWWTTVRQRKVPKQCKRPTVRGWKRIEIEMLRWAIVYDSSQYFGDGRFRKATMSVLLCDKHCADFLDSWSEDKTVWPLPITKQPPQDVLHNLCKHLPKVLNYPDGKGWLLSDNVGTGFGGRLKRDTFLKRVEVLPKDEPLRALLLNAFLRELHALRMNRHMLRGHRQVYKSLVHESMLTKLEDL